MAVHCSYEMSHEATKCSSHPHHLSMSPPEQYESQLNHLQPMNWGENAPWTITVFKTSASRSNTLQHFLPKDKIGLFAPNICYYK